MTTPPRVLLVTVLWIFSATVAGADAMNSGWDPEASGLTDQNLNWALVIGLSTIAAVWWWRQRLPKA